MLSRKYIFFDVIDNSISQRKVKGHVQLNEEVARVHTQLFIEGLKPQKYNVDILKNNNNCKNIGSFMGQNKVNKAFYLNEKMEEINAVLVYPEEDKKKTFMAAFLGDKKDKTILEELLREDSRKSEAFDYDIDKKDLKDIKVKLENTVGDQGKEEDESKEAKRNEGLYNNQIFYLWKNIDTLNDLLDSCEPFIPKIPNHTWWYIDEYNTKIQYYCILYNGYLMPMIYPFMNYKNIGNSKDWIFGFVQETIDHKEMLKYFVYGIPGRFTMQEQPFKGSTGYLYWQSIDIQNQNPIGYWLLYVDINTGKIVIPRRPVKPPLNKDIMHGQ